MAEDKPATFGSEGLNRVAEPQPAPDVNQEERATAQLEPGGPIQTPPAPEVHYGLRTNRPFNPGGGIEEAPSPGVDYSEMDPNAEDPAEDAAERAKRVVHAHGGNVVPPEYPRESRGLYGGDMPQTAKPGPEPDADDDEVARRRAAAETAKQAPDYPKEARGVDHGQMPQTEKPGPDPNQQRSVQQQPSQQQRPAPLPMAPPPPARR